MKLLALQPSHPLTRILHLINTRFSVLPEGEDFIVTPWFEEVLERLAVTEWFEVQVVGISD